MQGTDDEDSDEESDEEMLTGLEAKRKYPTFQTAGPLLKGCHHSCQPCECGLL